MIIAFQAMLAPISALAEVDINKRGPRGDSALHWMAFQGNAALASELIFAGANINEQIDTGATPLHLAAYNGHTKVIELLIENGAAINTRTSAGIRPLDWARRNGHEEAVLLLVSHGAVAGKPLPGRASTTLSRQGAASSASSAAIVDAAQDGQAALPAADRNAAAAAQEDVDWSGLDGLEDLEAVARVNLILAKYRWSQAYQASLVGHEAREPESAARPAASPGASFRIQLAAVSTARRALNARDQYLRQYPDILGGRALGVETFSSGEKEIHRVRSGMLPKSTAESLCDQLQQRSQACIVIGRE